MITAFLTFLGSSAFGSLLGGILGHLNKRLELKHQAAMRREEREHEVLMRDRDIALAHAEAEGKAKVAVIEGEGKIETARMEALAAAYASDDGPNDWVDKIRRSVRPVLTYVLVLAALAVNLLMLRMLPEVWPTLDAEHRARMFLEGVGWIGLQAGAALSFWFVSRSSTTK